MSNEIKVATKIILQRVNDDLFHAPDGRRMEREYGLSPAGNALGGNWVLRSPEGAFIDHDRYRHDLAARHGLDFNYGLDAACEYSTLRLATADEVHKIEPAAVAHLDRKCSG